MAIDETFLERIVAFGTEQGVFPGGRVAILGDCRFITAWASGDNRRDLGEFQRRYALSRVETLDIAGNPTITLDLHARVPEALQRQFDMVIDAGTMHCCFDVARVLENILLLAKARAAILHVSAFVGFTGRCFYKIDPSMFHDFYRQNGFSRIDLWAKPGSNAGIGIRLLRKLRRLLGLPVAHLEAIPADAMMIDAASAFSFHFAHSLQWAPAVLPNDSVIICAAWRDEARPFTRPIPSFFGG
jgi:hypothetical protein